MANKANKEVESRIDKRKQDQFIGDNGKKLLSILIPVAGVIILVATAIFYVYPKITSGMKESKPVATKEVREVKKEEKKEKAPEKTATKTEEKPSEKPAASDEDKEAKKEETKSTEYILPNSSAQPLTNEQLAKLSSSELRLARNEIYARHGMVFKSPDLTIYFSSKSWYSPNPAYDGSLSDIEKNNINFIKARE